MNLKPEKKSISNELMDKIKKGDLKMIPKTYFILRIILIIIGIIVILGASLYLASFLLFIIKRSGLWVLPIFGFRGMGMLASSFPWLIILITLFFIVLLEVVVKRHALIYRKPLLYSALAIIILVSLASFVISQTPMHKFMLDKVEKGRFSLARPLYGNLNMNKPKDVHVGFVLGAVEGGFIIKRIDGMFLSVSVSDHTTFYQEHEIKKGDKVFIIGKAEEGIIQAQDVKKPRMILEDLFIRNLW